MDAFERVIRKIGNWGTALGGVFLSLIALIITATVICRAVHVALPGTFDLVETLVVVAVSFALVYAQLQEGHIRADLAIERMHGRVKTGLETLLVVLSLVYWTALLWAGWTMMLEMWAAGEKTDILEVPVVPFRGVWIFALVIMVVLLVLKEIRVIRLFVKGEGE